MAQHDERVTMATERQASGTIKRRGLIAGAAALAAGLIARQATAPQSVAANDGNFLQLGHRFDANNTATTETGLYYNGVAPADGAILLVSDSPSPSIGYPAVIGGHAVNGSVLNGVSGRTYRVGGHGVVGEADGGAGATSSGVFGFADSGIGVYGTSQGVYGVYGVSSTPGGVGVSGNCTGGYGVLGTVSDGFGVLGQADTGNGVRGFAQRNHAIVGQTMQPYFGGVFGAATVANTVGIFGSTKSGGVNVTTAYAGYMDGNFVCANGVKSAAVPHADGTHRLVYCMESPENWFEDFGEGKLIGGKAEVNIPADFAAIVHTDDYGVFLTPEGDCKGLYVTAKTATGFAVRELQGGASSLSFRWRVVAKRKDITAARLAKFDLVGKAKHDAKPPQPPPPPPEPTPPSAVSGRRP